MNALFYCLLLCLPTHHWVHKVLRRRLDIFCRRLGHRNEPYFREEVDLSPISGGYFSCSHPLSCILATFYLIIRAVLRSEQKIVSLAVAIMVWKRSGREQDETKDKRTDTPTHYSIKKHTDRLTDWWTKSVEWWLVTVSMSKNGILLLQSYILAFYI